MGHRPLNQKEITGNRLVHATLGEAYRTVESVYKALAEIKAVDGIKVELKHLYDNFDVIAPVGSNIQSVINVEQIIDEVVTVAEDIDAVVTVSSSINNVNITAEDIDSIVTVAEDIANVNTIATNITDVNTVAGSISEVNRVSDSIVKVDRVYDSIDNLDRVYTSINKLDRVHTSIDNLDTVKAHIGNVDTVATDITNVNTVAGSISSVNTVAGSQAKVNRVYDSITKVDRVYDSISDIDTVSGSIVDVESVSGSINSINTVAPKITEVSTTAGSIGNVNTVAGSITSVDTVAPSIGNVNTVAGSIGSVNTVSGDIDKVVTTANSIGSVNTVSGSISNVNTVAGRDLDIGIVAGSIDSVNTTAGSITNVNLVADNETDISKVATSIGSVNTVATDIVDVGIVATNIGAVGSVANNESNVNAVAGIAVPVGTLATNIIKLQAIYDALDDLNSLGLNQSDFLLKSDNLSDLTNYNAARTNLGLGTAAMEDTSYFATSAQGTKAETAHSWGDHNTVGYLEGVNNLSDVSNQIQARSNLGLGTAATSDVIQTTGQSTSDIMSQKAVTDAIDSTLEGVLKPSNNLSDLTDTIAARANLGLGNVDNTADANKIVSHAATANGATAMWNSAKINGTTSQSGSTHSVRINNNAGSGENGVAALGFHCEDVYGIQLHLRADGTFGLGGWSSTAWRWYSNSNGDMVAAGNVAAYSDPRLKTDIYRITNAVDKVKKLNGVHFTWIDGDFLGRSGSPDLGVLSTEVAEVMPEAVSDSAIDSPDGDRYKVVAYEKLVPLLIEAVKELSAEVQILKEKIQ